MAHDFSLLMIAAMYENGGNVTHRLLDGHPQMLVYPFESQLGTRLVSDPLASMFPVKYRWPVFALDATPEEDYAAIVDEECKVRARTPEVSKFRHVPFDFSDDDRRDLYVREIAKGERSRARNVEAFFRATFGAWKDRVATGSERVYVGYSPIVVVDTVSILGDFPDAHVLHVVRNPWSAYADTKKRPVPLSLPHYMTGWVVNQHHALCFQRKFPDRVHVVRTEDVVRDPRATLGAVCRAMGLDAAESLRTPSWNGRPLDEVVPWGTIRKATPEANLAAAAELSARERSEIADLAWPYLDALDYGSFVTP